MEYLKHDDTTEALKKACHTMLEILDTYEFNTDRCCLKEIQAVMKNSAMDDFEVVEEIVCIMTKYGYRVGTRHDFS